jgi:hypothetical protein
MQTLGDLYRIGKGKDDNSKNLTIVDRNFER